MRDACDRETSGDLAAGWPPGRYPDQPLPSCSGPGDRLAYDRCGAPDRHEHHTGLDGAAWHCSPDGGNTASRPVERNRRRGAQRTRHRARDPRAAAGRVHPEATVDVAVAADRSVRWRCTVTMISDRYRIERLPNGLIR